LASAACTNRLHAGNSTSATVSGLATNVVCYFSVVASRAAGQESPSLRTGAPAVGSELVEPTELDIQFKGGGLR
jgi:hypothetical protein